MAELGLEPRQPGWSLCSWPLCLLEAEGSQHLTASEFPVETLPQDLTSLTCGLFNLFIYLSVYLFIYLFMAVLGLCFCARAFSSCSKWGPLFIAVHGPLIIAASLVGSTGSRRAGSVIVAHRPSCSVACGIFPDQGSNPCPLH